MRTFLDLCERGRYQDAAVFLDVPHGTEKRAPDLAARLYAVLQQRLAVKPEQLSPLSHGRSHDGLSTGIEELGKIDDGRGHPVPIRLVRHDARTPEDEPRWVFSQSTLTHVDALYSALQDRWIRDHLPGVVLTQGPMALYYWQWLALPLLAALCLATGRVLSLLSGLVAARILRRHPWGGRLLHAMKQPTTLGWALATFVLLTPHLSLTLRADELIDRGLAALAYLALFWALLRLVGLVGDEVAAAGWARRRPSVRSLSAVGVRLGKVVVAALALMVFLSELGYPVTSVVAGLGIGGVALALAAQKTIENLFGSVAILADQPFRLGDTIRVDTIEGTVESIGLRSTRVRTVERTLVVFPNGKLADMRIESLGPRDRIRFATKLPLSRTATMEQVRRIIADLKERLAAQALVKQEDVSVALTSIGETSYDVEVSAPIDTVDATVFARTREALLVMCVEVVEGAGTQLAVPTRRFVATAA
jgi:MscS family membrane protein